MDKKIFYIILWGCVCILFSIRLLVVIFIMIRLSKKGVGNKEYFLGNDIFFMVCVIFVDLFLELIKVFVIVYFYLFLLSKYA